MYIKSNYLFIILSLSVMLISCNYDNEEELFGDPLCGQISEVSLQSQIRPILASNCYACHDASAVTAGVNLENYETLKEVADQGRLRGAIRHLDGYPAMPPSGNALDECDIRRIETWIEEGAQNN